MPIENFEDIDTDLTEQDKALAIKVCGALISQKDKGEFSGALMRRALQKQGFGNIGGAKMRSMVHYMREADIPLREFDVQGYVIATGKGYRFTQVPDEIRSHILSLDQRTRSIHAVRKCAHLKFLAMTGTQIKMDI